MNIQKLFCRFGLPYIVQPEGTFEFKYGEEVFDIIVKHHIVGPLFEISTGFVFNPQQPVGVRGPKEIFIGISEVSVGIPVLAPQDISRIDDTEIRNKIANILNEFQYRYLYCTGKYWWNPVSADHFVNMRFDSKTFKGFSSNWGGSHRQSPSFIENDETLLDFRNVLAKGERLPNQYVFLIDAKNHYLSGEYHLMYVEIAIALESLVNKAFKKISDIFEQKMFKEGKLGGQITYILHQCCKWTKEDIEKAAEIWERRNQVIHNNRRDFPHQEAYEHLVLGEKAIKEITSWIRI